MSQSKNRTLDQLLLYNGKGRGAEAQGVLVKREFDFKDIWCREQKYIFARNYSAVHIRIQATVWKLLNKNKQTKS